MNAREEVLRRVRAATADVAEKDPALDVPIDWTYGRPLETADVLADFVEKVEDYKATVVRCSPAEVAASVVAALTALGAGSVVLPDGTPDDWAAAATAAGLAVHRDDPTLSHAERQILVELLQRDFLNRVLPLPSGTEINLTLDSSFNLDQLVSDLMEIQRARNVSGRNP